MQPYIFPYLGYYQLVHAVDTFVFFDDVNFINKGWINRNNILQQDKPLRFTVPLVKASQNKLINEIEIADYGKWRKEFLKTVEMNYKKAPHFTLINEWLTVFLANDQKLISEFAAESVTAIARLLNVQTEFSFSSTLHYKTSDAQDGQMKVLEICNMLGADTYINPKNGVDLYNSGDFEAKNIKLQFINMDEVKYQQLKADVFVQNLSILDVLFFNGIDGTKELLPKYSLN